MSDNIVAIYGDVPELVEKQSAEIISQFLKSDRDDFNFVKYNLYETEIAPIVEETLTLPFFSDKKAILVKNAYIFTGEKAPKDMAHNVDQLIEFIEKYDGGPVGIDTIAAAISEERDTIEDVYEPYLMQLGFLGRTPRGRVATKLAYEHLGISQTGK